MMRLNYFIWIFFTFGSQWTQAAHLRYYRSSLDDYKETNIRNPMPLLQWVDLSKPTLFYSFGFNSNPNSVQNITSAYLKRNDTNYILVNWEEEAKNEALEKVIARALTVVPNSIKIGEELGMSLVQLSCGLDMSSVQLAGHSLGAHVVGYAGLFAGERGVVIARITALDPSGPKYEGFVHTKGLNKSSAAFVSVWHSNPGYYGTTEALGHVDVWFNCKDTLQPGCKEGDFPAFTEDSLCSHSRTISYFIESVNSADSFIATSESSCQNWGQDNTGNSITVKDYIYVNDKMDTCASGNYYLSTNAESPYGKGFKGLIPN